VTLQGNVTISANVFSDVRTNIEIKHARGVVITGNTFWEGFDYDLVVENSTDIVVGANNFDKPRSYEMWQKEVPKQGIVFRDCDDCTLTGVHVHGVRQQTAGVEIDNCRRMHISGLTIYDCDSIGLLLRNVSKSTVHGCVIRDDRSDKETFRPLVIEGGSENRITE
jgi:polygalacturonase